jgi:hypothetical protein
MIHSIDARVGYESSTNVENAAYWINTARSVFEGEKVIVTGRDIANGILPRARLIRRLGAISTFMLATEGMGTGEMPGETDGPYLALETTGTGSVLEAMHATRDLLANLPPHALSALESYDPSHSALVVGTATHELPLVANRKSLYHRKPEWIELDDKTVIDGVWDRIGIHRERSTVVPLDRHALTTASSQLDSGEGVVWSGDSRDGVGGGAELVRRIHTREHADDAFEFFSKHCDAIRVMPFLEGTPCSIHGIVFPDYVVALRPVETIVLRQTGTNEFFFAGAATFWDSTTVDREYMRDVVKRSGAVLRDSVAYAGLFTVDGVMTKNGFRPTELNPRSGSGIKPLLTGLPNLPLELISQTIQSNKSIDYRPQEFEQLLLSAADRYRGGASWRQLPQSLPEMDKRPLRYKDGVWSWANDGETDGWVSIGVSPVGSMVRLSPNSSLATTGTTFAPIARDFWKFIDTQFNCNIGPLETPKSVR